MPSKSALVYSLHTRVDGQENIWNFFVYKWELWITACIILAVIFHRIQLCSPLILKRQNCLWSSLMLRQIKSWWYPTWLIHRWASVWLGSRKWTAVSFHSLLDGQTSALSMDFIRCIVCLKQLWLYFCCGNSEIIDEKWTYMSNCVV